MATSSKAALGYSHSQGDEIHGGVSKATSAVVADLNVNISPDANISPNANISPYARVGESAHANALEKLDQDDSADDVLSLATDSSVTMSSATTSPPSSFASDDVGTSNERRNEQSKEIMNERTSE